MLDSSPIPVPPPKKLKRTASAASLPSPPPSVEHQKKRTASQRYTGSGDDSDLGSDDQTEELAKGEKVLGRKLLFPVGPSLSSVPDDPEDPFLGSCGPSNARDQLALDATSSPSVCRPMSPPPSRRKTVKPSIVSPKTPPPVSQRGAREALELPISDEENNPFLSRSPPKLPRAPSSREFVEPETITYVFKGVKTSFPNPNYNLPESVYERSRLPLEDPEYSPPPTRPPRRLFQEAYLSKSDLEDEDEDADDGLRKDIGIADADSHTSDPKPRVSRLFVDSTGHPLPESGPEGIRGKTMDSKEIGRMAVGPIRGRG